MKEKTLAALSALIASTQKIAEIETLERAHRLVASNHVFWQVAQGLTPLPEYAEITESYALIAVMQHAANNVSVAAHYVAYLASPHAIVASFKIARTLPAESRLALLTHMPYFTGANVVSYTNKNGKTVSAKIGKMLTKLLPALTEKERYQLADNLKREFSPQPPANFLIAKTDDPDLWADIYQRAASVYQLTSCMTNPNGINAIRGYACAHLLPDDARASQINYALAYLADDDGIPYARAIVNTKTKEFITTYSAYTGEMEKTLNAAGYRYSVQALDGMYIHAGDCGECAPYVDGHHDADDVYFGGIRFWRVTSCGNYTLDSTSGFAPDYGEQCGYCGSIVQELYLVNDYSRAIDSFSESCVCEACRDSEYTFVPSESEYYPNAYITTDNRGDTIIMHSSFTDNHVNIGDEWYHIDDAVYSEFHDDYIPEEDALYIDFLEDYIHCRDLTLSSREEEGFWDFWYNGLNQQAIENNCHISQMESAA